MRRDAGRVDHEAGAGRRLEIGVLGPLEVRRRGELIEIGPAMVRTLLAVLALHPGAVVPREEIAGVLWGGEPPATYVNLVQVYVSRLRSQLRTAGRPAHSMVRAERGGYRLEVDREAVDLTRFDDLCAAAERLLRDGDQDGASAHYEAALRCWRGPVLADLGGAAATLPVVVAAGERRVAAALEYARLCRTAGRPAAAAQTLREITAIAPLHEGLHAALMQSVADAGDRAGALTAYDHFRRRLAEDLGVHPGAELQAVHQELLHAPEPDPRTRRVGGPLADDGASGSPAGAAADERPPVSRRFAAASPVLVAALAVVLVVGLMAAFWAVGRHPTPAAERSSASARPAAPQVRSSVSAGPAAPQGLSFRSTTHWSWAYAPTLGSTPTAAQWASAHISGLRDSNSCAGFRLRVGVDPQGNGDEQGFFLGVCPTRWKIEADPVDGLNDGDVPLQPAEGLLRVAVTDSGLITIEYAGQLLTAKQMHGGYPWSHISPGMYQADGHIVMSDIRSNASRDPG